MIIRLYSLDDIIAWEENIMCLLPKLTYYDINLCQAQIRVNFFNLPRDKNFSIETDPLAADEYEFIHYES